MKVNNDWKMEYLSSNMSESCWANEPYEMGTHKNQLENRGETFKFKFKSYMKPKSYEVEYLYDFNRFLHDNTEVGLYEWSESVFHVWWYE